MNTLFDMTAIRAACALDRKTLVETALKTSEEVGEMAQATLHAGAHGTEYRALDSADLVAEEAVDVILCALAVAVKAGSSDDDIRLLFAKKTEKWTTNLFRKKADP
jgi:NTP pyrophosphatase (non-canonical NTP hydrolase)